MAEPHILEVTQEFSNCSGKRKASHLADIHVGFGLSGTHLWDAKTGYPYDLESVRSPV